LIGSNNSGKSSVLNAIEYLLSGKKTILSSEYYSIIDEETGETKPAVSTIVFEAEFRNLPEDARFWRGFKGRIFEYTPSNDEDTGLSVTYRKTYELGKDAIIEFKSKVREISEEYKDCKSPKDYIACGVPEAELSDLFPEIEKNIGKSKDALEKLEQLDCIWTIQEEETWFKNPGGIPGNVLKMLPRILIIPADTSVSEIEGGSGVLGKTLNELFEDVRASSVNYKQAQNYLDELAKELNPEDHESEFGKMLKELNEVLASVFPDSKLHATTDLSDPSKAIKPSFNIEMSSNVRTPVNHQGSGMIRSAAFGMLRFRQKWLSRREDEHKRALIVCFEEPEIYLHPSAANQMRDAIYDLSGSESQIIATTHSPFIIDLSRKPMQVLNSMVSTENGVNSNPFNVTEAYLKLEAEDKSYVKMLLKIDVHIARVFFTKHVIIVEGDTEDILLRETIKKLEKEVYLKIVSNFEIVKARGKAAIIGLVKYLLAMGIEPIVIQDRDQGIAGAEKFNKPIADALNSKGKLILMHENVEQEIGYPPPSSEKPYMAFLESQKWGDTWEGIPEKWKIKVREIFGEYIQN
jgi:putative ATP-dependent endonuclease of the OLD family